METNFFVFTEAFNCGKILSVCLESYHRHHTHPIHIIGTSKDFNDAGEIINHPNNVLINWDNKKDAADRWSNGHSGTALAFSSVIGNSSITEKKLIVHVDADCYFKGECLSEIFTLLDSGYSIIGSPRPYKNNLSGVSGLENTPDCVSTYIMGVNKESIKMDFDFDFFTRMCAGGASPSRDRVLDFFDPVTHWILRNGGKPYYLDTVKYGGIDLSGSKNNGFQSNLNFDCGTLIAHFGGVGSGLAVSEGRSNPPKSYADWANYRWNFYSHLFFETAILSDTPTVYSSPNDHGGKRWCAGPADINIIESAKKEIL